MATLKVIQGQQQGHEFPLGPNRSVIGRSTECDVVLEVAAVSRRHAVIVETDGQYVVEDLGSRNGTYVNDKRVVDSAPLSRGDQLLICDVLLEFRLPEPESTPEKLSGVAPVGASLLDAGENLPEDEESSCVQATFDVSKGTSSPAWQLSAKPEVQLKAMLEISSSLSNTLSIQDILPKILDSLFKIFVQADRGFIIMRPEEDGPWVPVASKARRSEDEANMRMSSTIVEQAIQGKKAILSVDTAMDERFNMAQSISEFEIRSLICSPLIDSEGEPLGVIQIDTRNQLSKFIDLDLQILAGVASQAAIAMDNARMHEEAIEQRAVQRDLEVARQMQHALLPKDSPKQAGYHFFEFYESAQQVGGDYYDYVLLSDDRFAVVVGDVAGKGVSAGILMAKLSSDVRFWLAKEPDAAKALGEINAAFSRHEWDDRFVTMILAVVDPRKHSLTLVNAGHMPPMLRSAAGEVTEIGGQQAGLPVGVMDDYQYESYQHELAPGDILTMFTDGFSEAMNSERELFGIEKLAATIRDQKVQPHELGPHVLEAVRKFAGSFPQSDDMCLVCFGREEQAGE